MSERCKDGEGDGVAMDGGIGACRGKGGREEEGSESQLTAGRFLRTSLKTLAVVSWKPPPTSSGGSAPWISSPLPSPSLLPTPCSRSLSEVLFSVVEVGLDGGAGGWRKEGREEGGSEQWRENQLRREEVFAMDFGARLHVLREGREEGGRREAGAASYSKFESSSSPASYPEQLHALGASGRDIAFRPAYNQPYLINQSMIKVTTSTPTHLGRNKSLGRTQAASSVVPPPMRETEMGRSPRSTIKQQID
jgi:hypothetical protein